ncbi:pyridoxamine 5'-phosphate oxidase family protein [Reichenbachiella carrageenanivorans]|uniref:Pyridoxamine 5'-phosphate oxidase family protein n=1 Tax=Reichenbachiella carrageenanivorans TaxID=2979869 RepID=A0ABY6D572_9BACT|nr:pyridoxamine 5'-phosphate oxidase family protein [Reichenbachiella carrageenanivorans]UXX78995.1 pyridoxamine 5'-phosphate oxidase family protein [Reichenbachiella carrageenanivorans]
MGKLLPSIDEHTLQFIKTQKMFFVATAATTGKVNLSPKGSDSFRVLSPNQVAWLNLTGSGNETAAHLLENNRMTIMMCAFEGKPNIMRLYGTAKAIYEQDPEWTTYSPLFEDNTGARQIFLMEVNQVQHSCGMAVPLYDYIEQRDLLDKTHDKLGREKVKEYWKAKNMVSLDGLPTGQKI